MSTYTVCFCGTDCWPDESMKLGDAHPGTPNEAFGSAGYIPVRIHADLQAPYRKAIVPGPGSPYFQYWRSLWVPCTVKDPFAIGDTALGTSMWDLAGHAAARVVGIPSIGRKQSDLLDLSDPAIMQLINGVKIQVGADLRPDSTRKPPSHDRYQWSPELLEVLLGSMHASTQYRPIDKINLVGHSRGAVAAIMCSHELETLFPNAEVNIFAIDPVPGLGPLSKEMTTLGRTVKNYVGVYAVDEVSNGFNGVVPCPFYEGQYLDPLEDVGDKAAQIRVPNYHLIYSPGRHSTVAGNRTKNGTGDVSKCHDDTSLIGHTVYQLAWACLTRWGSILSSTTKQGMLHPETLQGALVGPRELYREMRQTTYTGTGSILPQHLRERGVSSTSGSNPLAWCYLEDAIGGEPLVERSLLRNAIRRGPGKVKWQAIEYLRGRVFDSTSTDIDRYFE